MDDDSISGDWDSTDVRDSDSVADRSQDRQFGAPARIGDRGHRRRGARRRPLPVTAATPAPSTATPLCSSTPPRRDAVLRPAVAVVAVLPVEAEPPSEPEAVPDEPDPEGVYDGAEALEPDDREHSEDGDSRA